MRSMSMRPGRIFQFGRFQVDALARTLRREEATVRLNARAFDVLLYLVQNPGKVLTHEELLKNVWQDAFVDENSLAQSISQLRRALEEKPGENSYIVTLPGRGYQFASAVQVVASEDGGIRPEAATAGRSNSSGLIFQQHTVQTSVITDEKNKQLSSPTSLSRQLVRVVAVVLAVVVAVVLVVRFRSPQHPEPKHELLERWITATSPDDSIVCSALSRDGKFLAYSDRAGGLFVLEIATGETRSIASGPPTLHVRDWFPDGTHLLVYGSGAKSGTWKMSIWDGTMRKISDEEGMLISPDGQHISVSKDDGIWSMSIEGEQEHRMVPLEAGEVLGGSGWSPDGRRFAFVRSRLPAKPTVEVCDVSGTNCTTLLSEARLRGAEGISDLTWLPDGRILFWLAELPPNQSTVNIWAVDAGPGTDRSLGKPERITSWVGFVITGTSQFRHSADGRRLAFNKTHVQDTVKIAELNRETGKLGSVRRLTNDNWQDDAKGWTRDSKSVLFTSERNGGNTVYQQPVTGTSPRALVLGPESYVDPIFTPDGSWLLYTAYSGAGGFDQASSRLMRRPAQGGPPSVVLSGRYSYDCAAPPSKLCVLAERKDKQIVFESLDPINGRGSKLASVELAIDAYHWSLSPDGKNIALARYDDSGVSIVSLENGTVKQLELKNWSDFQYSKWSADGHSIYVGAQGPDAWTIFNTNLAGNTKVLVEVPLEQGWLATPEPSPDGRFLAFTERTYENNATMLENF
jgi:DNA-binding winged helix-turn-helix (wHTH) protein/Tol biopolymer transport system component